MKSIISTLFILFLFFFFGCSKNDDTSRISANLPKIKNIIHITSRDTIQENFYYNEEGLLQIIENFQGRINSTNLLKYADGRLIEHGCYIISYNALGQIEKAECISVNMVLIQTKEYQYNSDGKISSIKQFYSDEYLASIPEDERPFYEEEEFLYYWEKNNVKKSVFNLNGAFYLEDTYEYDNSINYKAAITSLKTGAELSENNVILTRTTFADGGIDPFCFTCPLILEYDEQGRVIKITEPNEGFGSPDPRIKLITYVD